MSTQDTNTTQTERPAEVNMDTTPGPGEGNFLTNAVSSGSPHGPAASEFPDVQRKIMPLPHRPQRRAELLELSSKEYQEQIKQKSNEIKKLEVENSTLRDAIANAYAEGDLESKLRASELMVVDLRGIVAELIEQNEQLLEDIVAKDKYVAKYWNLRSKTWKSGSNGPKAATPAAEASRHYNLRPRTIQKAVRVETQEAIRVEAAAHEPDMLDPNTRIVNCTRCQGRLVQCDGGTPCKLCSEIGRTCKRLRCDSFELGEGKCTIENCLRAHPEDGYTNTYTAVPRNRSKIYARKARGKMMKRGQDPDAMDVGDGAHVAIKTEDTELDEQTVQASMKRKQPEETEAETTEDAAVKKLRLALESLNTSVAEASSSQDFKN